MKWCYSCEETKPLDEFYKNKNKSDGLQSKCKECCSAAMRVKYAANPEYYKSRAKISRNNDPTYARKERARRAGITVEQLNDMEAIAKGRCMICGSEELLLRIDHCHRTGRFRGLLCGGCNIGIGHLQDSPTVLRAAIKYLQRV